MVELCGDVRRIGRPGRRLSTTGRAEIRDAGHRALPRAADLRIEAWAPDRAACVAEAVAAAVESFVDVGQWRARGRHRTVVWADGDAGILAAVLDEMIFVLETLGVVPVWTRLRPAPRQLRHRIGARRPAPFRLDFGLVDLADLTQVGAAPKAVSLRGLHLDRRPRGWTCEVTIDV